MAKRNKRTRTASVAAPGAKRAETGPRDWPQATIAVAGMVLTAVLMWAAQSRSALPYCAAGSGCDVVQGSAWSRFLGLPLALWGFVLYGLLAGLALSSGAKLRRWRATALLSSAGFGISVYLTAVSLTFIGAWCGYCLLSLGLLGGAVGLAVWRRPAGAAPRPFLAGAAAAVVLALAMHANAQGWLDGTGPADPQLVALAEHLSERGARFYGARWCPSCQEQKVLFGSAAPGLPYVECSPHGPRAPRATDCEMADIRNYPTWILDGRRLEGVFPPPQLARMTGFDWRGESP
ncbi:MAG: vitamin K epoxide reductase family protein [Gammaproteobacteria bacterium]